MLRLFVVLAGLFVAFVIACTSDSAKPAVDVDATSVPTSASFGFETAIPFESLSAPEWSIAGLGAMRPLPRALQDGSANLTEEELVGLWDEYLRGIRLSIQGARNEEWAFCENRTAMVSAPFLNDVAFRWSIEPDPGGSRGSVRMLTSDGVDLTMDPNLPTEIQTSVAVWVADGEMRIRPQTQLSNGRLDDPYVVTELEDCPLPPEMFGE